MPAITEVNKVNQAMVFKILMLYGGFGFALTYIETIIANLRSLPGDRRVGVKSLAAQLGFDMAKKVAVISRSEEHTSELQSRGQLVCRLLLEEKNNTAGAVV